MTSATPRSLLAPSDIADIAEVGRSVVSNWRTRHSDFPKAVAGTAARPLFDSEQVIDWLRARGYQVANTSAGAPVWAAMNASRGVLDAEDTASLLLALAVVKHAQAFDFEGIAEAPDAQVAERLEEAASMLDDCQLSAAVRRAAPLIASPRVNARLVVDAIGMIPDGQLAEAMDFVLDRLARAQIKKGADSGFVGSRTSELLAAAIGHTTGVVLDPACGIGDVLVRVAKRGKPCRLFGVDVNRQAVDIAAQRAFLHGITVEFAVGDSLRADPLPDIRADVVIVEPPYGMLWDPAPGAITEPKFAFGVPPKRSADLAWIEHAVSHLSPAGSGYVLTHPGALFRTGPEAQIRANMVSAGCLKAVVALPPKMLPHTQIGVALWVLKNAATPEDVLVVDATEVDDPEQRIADWLAAPPGGLDVPHANVPVTEILTAQADLTPSKWIATQPVNKQAIQQTFDHATASLRQAVSIVGESRMMFAGLTNLIEPRIATVQELDTNGVIKVRAGRPDKARQLDDTTELRIVRAADVKTRHLPPVAGLPSLEDPDVTQEGDVLVTTMNEVRAVVDETGGHLPSTGIERLRILDTSVVTPEYLALVLTGSWNRRFQSGLTIQRARVRDLEVPLIPLADQHRVAEAQAAVDSLRRQGEKISEQARVVRELILDAVRHNVPLNRPEGSVRGEPGTARDRM